MQAHFLHAFHHHNDDKLQVIIASYAEDEIQNRFYLTPFPVKAALDIPGTDALCVML